MQTAVELDVDKTDFRFQSIAEALLWDELEAEFVEVVDRVGRDWIAG